MAFRDMFRLKKPCENCPFRKNGAIALEPGRMQGIVDSLLSDDWSTFQCHKSVHNAKTGGQWDDEGQYLPSGKESMCAGAIIYLEKAGRPSVGMRIGRVLGVYAPQRLEQFFTDVLDPALEQACSRGPGNSRAQHITLPSCVDNSTPSTGDPS